jgi:hypothetical protein
MSQENVEIVRQAPRAFSHPRRAFDRVAVEPLELIAHGEALAAVGLGE